MEKFIVTGGYPLQGEINVAGAKNVALKTCVASLLTDEPVMIKNVPLIGDLMLMKELLENLGVEAAFNGHQIRLQSHGLTNRKVPLELGARMRTSSLIVGPMLARAKEAVIPNPGGCRIGARPIDRHIEGLRQMGAEISYESKDGYFHATTKQLHGAHTTFTKNTHTGTEAIILAAVLAQGKTVISGAAQEIEIDDLITMLNQMGAIIRRNGTEIIIDGVDQLHGVEYEIMSDRNEEVTMAIAAAMMHGSITVVGSKRQHLDSFYEKFIQTGGIIEKIDARTTRYSSGPTITAADIITLPHPGFMTDWQAPWAVYMTQARGVSTIHETVFENRFTYVPELTKMGADIEYFHPNVPNPDNYYNFNWNDRLPDSSQAIRIHGPVTLHNAVITMNDLRSGASLLLAAMAAKGKSYIYGIEQIDRGYESIDERFNALGARIERVQGDAI